MNPTVPALTPPQLPIPQISQSTGQVPQIQFDADTLSRIKAATAAGYDPTTVMQKAASYQASKAQSSMQPSLPDSTMGGGSKWSDLLPLGGGILGSMLGLLGGIPGSIAGGAAGSGLGELARQKMTNSPTDVGSIAKETALGGAGGIAGEGLGFLGDKLLGLLGGKLAGAGEALGIKGLRLNPSQLTKFATKHKEDVGTFLGNEGALGKDSTQLFDQHIQPIQDQFNAIAKTSGLTVDPQNFYNHILQQATDLRTAGGSENEAIANKLHDEAQFVLDHNLNPANNDISAYDNLRRTFASKVDWQDPNKAALNYAMADALRKSVIDTADQAGAKGTGGVGLKDIGIKLSKYYDLYDSAVKQEALGKGSMPLGITKWLSIGAGLGAGGPLGGAAGLAANAVLNHPAFLRGAATGAVKAGDALSSGNPLLTALTTILGNTGGESATHGGDVASAMSSMNTPPDPNMAGGSPLLASAGMSDSGMGQPSTPGVPSSYNTPDNPSKTPQDMMRQVLATLMFKRARNPSEMAQAYDFLYPQASFQNKPLNSQQQLMKANAESGLKALGVVASTLQSDPNAPLKANVPIIGQQTPYKAATKEVADVLTRLRTGAALNKDEQQFYASQLPQPFDSPQTIMYKLNLFQNLFSKMAYGQIPAYSSSGTSDSQAAFSQ